MFRRLTAIFIVCASLFGLAQPLMACAAEKSMSDCCPGNPASGCTTDTMPGPVVGGSSCCVVSPAASTSSFLLPSRAVEQPLSDSGSPDPFLVAHLKQSAGSVFSACVSIPTYCEAPRANATLLYLLTARLRL